MRASRLKIATNGRTTRHRGRVALLPGLVMDIGLLATRWHRDCGATVTPVNTATGNGLMASPGISTTQSQMDCRTQFRLFGLKRETEDSPPKTAGSGPTRDPRDSLDPRALGHEESVSRPLSRRGCAPSCHSRPVASDAMNPNRDRAIDIRRRALADQVDGLEQLIAAGRDEPHIAQRLLDTRAELERLESLPAQ